MAPKSILLSIAIVLALTTLGSTATEPNADGALLPLRTNVKTTASLPEPPQPGLTLHVTPNGDIQGDGSAQKPFATLEQARDYIRTVLQGGVTFFPGPAVMVAGRQDGTNSKEGNTVFPGPAVVVNGTNASQVKTTLRRPAGTMPEGGITVLVHGGDYIVKSPVAFTAQDCGKSNAPIRYCAAPGETPRFRGGVRLTGWKQLTDPQLYPLLPRESVGKVWFADLVSLGATNILPLKLGGFASGNGFNTHPAHELFFNGKAMQLSRGPNKGFLRAADVVDKDGTKGYDREGSKSGIFTYTGDLPTKWAAEPDLLLYGYWFWDWADSYERVASIDTARHVITLAKPWHNYGFRIGAPFYAYNALSELDAPGEWYLDRQNGRLLFYAPSDPNAATVELSTFGETMLTLDNVSEIRFEGLTWELGSADAIHMNGGRNNVFAGCTIRHFAGNAVEAHQGFNNKFISCDIYSMGRGGLSISGGNRHTLAVGEILIENCDIHDLSRIDHTYTPAILVDGVGNKIRHNRLHEIQSSAIRLGGNNHVVEYNEVYNVVTESDDQGGIDMWGNPTFRGNKFRYNYWHHIGSWKATDEQPACGQCAIRLDDAICGTHIHGNIFERCSAGKTGFGGVQIHGGKDNTVENNIFIDCSAMVSCSPWDAKHWQEFVGSALESKDINKALYLQTYPELSRLLDDINLNHIRNNRALRCKELLRRAPKNLDATNNVQLPDAPFTLDPRNPLFMQAGFEMIPIEEIGAYADAWRKPGVTKPAR